MRCKVSMHRSICHHIMGELSLLDRLRQTALITFLFSTVLHIGASFVVKRDGEPFFIKTPTNITVHEGDLAVLKCHIDRLGPKMVNVVVWRKMSEDFPLTIGKMTFSPEDEMAVDHSKLSPSSSTWDLLIKDVKPHHSGIYECQVSANHLIAQYVSLHVLKRSKIKSELKIRGTEYVNSGNEIRLTCNATGVLRAPESVEWFFEGQRIHPSNKKWRNRVEILKRTSYEGKYFLSELIIERSNIEDKGSYVCRSSNMESRDTDVDSLKVHVLGVEKDNLTRRDSDKDVNQKSGHIRTAPAGGASVTCHDTFSVLVFAAVALVWR